MMDFKIGSRIRVYAYCKGDTISRLGVRWYGLIAYRTPLLAWFVDDAWYHGSISYGLACGPCEIGFFIESEKDLQAQAKDKVK